MDECCDFAVIDNRSNFLYRLFQLCMLLTIILHIYNYVFEVLHSCSQYVSKYCVIIGKVHDTIKLAALIYAMH